MKLLGRRRGLGVGESGQAKPKPGAAGEARVGGGPAFIDRRVEWLAVTLLVGLFVWKGLAPAWARIDTDFPNYYLAAKLLRGGYPIEHVYDMVWFQRQKDHAGIDWSVVRYVPLSPLSALILAPLAGLSALAAKRCWLCVDLLFLLGSIAGLRRMTALPTRRIALIVFLSIVPLRNEFQFGQQYVLILFLLVVAGRLFLAERQAASGATLALATVLKLYPVLFAVVFLAKRRWHALASLCATSGVLIALAAATLGPRVLRVYLVEVLPRALAGEGNDPYHAGFNTLAVLLRRLFVAEHDLNPHPLIDAPVLYALLEPASGALLLGSALWLLPLSRSRERTVDALEWGAIAALTLVLSKSSSTYHFCTLVLATVLGVDYLVRRGRIGAAVALVLLHAAISAPLYRFVPTSPAGWGNFLSVPRLWLLLAYWGVLLGTCAHAPRTSSWRGWEGAVPLLIALVLGLTGVRSSLRRVRWEHVARDAPLPARRPTPFASAPTVEGENVSFAYLDREGFALGCTRWDVRCLAPPRADLLFPSAAPPGQADWVEVSALRSAAARFSLDGARPVCPSDASVDDAEQPKPSPDGRWLGFVREERGLGSLWIADLRSATSNPRSSFVERQVLGAREDVLDFAFFPDGRIVAALGRGARRGMVIASPSGEAVADLGPIERQARYPAVSPSGRWLAYSALVHGAWNLRALRLATGERRELTGGDCNSVSPAWTSDSNTVVYASDCGRALGDTALRQVPVEP